MHRSAKVYITSKTDNVLIVIPAGTQQDIQHSVRLALEHVTVSVKQRILVFLVFILLCALLPLGTMQTLTDKNPLLILVTLPLCQASYKYNLQNVYMAIKLWKSKKQS